MHDAFARERRPVRHDELLAAAPGERRMLRHIADARRLHVGRGEDREHALSACAALASIALDVGAGMRRAHEAGVGLARQRRVGHKAAGAAQQRVVLDALRGLVRRLHVHVG